MAPHDASDESKSDDAIASNGTRRRDRGIDMARKDDDRNPKIRRAHRSIVGAGKRERDIKMPSKSSKSSTGGVSSSKRGSITASRDEAPHENGAPRRRHRRTLSHPESSSDSDSDSDSDHVGANMEAVDHRAALAAARARLTSPSLLSTLTSLTTATNNSGGSSGSNSTITQASMTRRRAEELPEVPLSPAVPDPPDVFSFLEKDSPSDSDSDDEEEADYVPPNWPNPEPQVRPSTPEHAEQSRQRRTSSSGSSSFHSDSSTFDVTPADQDQDSSTDRSTSPEHSVKSGGEDDLNTIRSSPTRQTQESSSALNPDLAVPTSPAAAKFAAQMLAAQHRQSLHSNIHQTHPTYPYPSPYAPPAPQQASYPPFAIQTPHSAQFQHFSCNAPPRGSSTQLKPPHVQQRRTSRSTVSKTKSDKEAIIKRELSGYEGLADALSQQPSIDSRIQPIYRKFSSLNHRVLLTLQDELSELEDALKIIDSADDTSRSLIPLSSPADSSSTLTKTTAPASRRQPQDHELELHRRDLLLRIAAKLAHYNAALTSFQSLQASLPAAHTADIARYRAFLAEEAPVVERERLFLERDDDLVSIASDTSALVGSNPKPVLHDEQSSSTIGGQKAGRVAVMAFAIAAAVAVLVPILTFGVIPGFLGRMTVVLLVGTGILGALIQGGVVGVGKVCGREGMVVGGVYGGLMVVLAGAVV